MAISITKATVGGNENSWGSLTNTALDTIVDAVNGTTGTVEPNLSALKINGTAVTASAAELNKLDGASVTTAQLNVLGALTASAAELNKLTGCTTSTAELNYVDGVTSNIQTQFSGLSSVYAPLASPTFTGTVTTPGVTVSGGTQNWTAEVDSNELFLKYGGTSKAKVPDTNTVVGHLGEQSTSTWTTGTGTTESLISPVKLKGAIDSQLNVSGSAPIYGVRAWVNFVSNGSSSANATLNGSGNIATVYKTGTGNFTATFTTAMPDANYAITFAAGVTTSASANDGTCIDVYSRSASAFSFTVTDPSGNNYANPHTVMITVVR